MCLTKKVFHWVMYYDWIHQGTKTDIIFLEQDPAPCTHLSNQAPMHGNCRKTNSDQYNQGLSDGWSFAKVG